ncbi:MAG: hypothetical protein WAL98_06790 [Desulfatiglandaceae bacterium]|jgi:hypothetical protein
MALIKIQDSLSGTGYYPFPDSPSKKMKQLVELVRGLGGADESGAGKGLAYTAGVGAR